MKRSSAVFFVLLFIFAVNSYAVTEVVKIVDPDNGAGTDYTSLAAFIAAVPSNLVTVDEQWTAKCRSTGGSSDSTSVTITGKTTDATHYIKIWTDPAEGYRHNGTYETGNHYRLTGTFGGAENGLTIEISYTKIYGIQIYNTLTTSGRAMSINDNVSNTIVDSCIFKATADQAFRFWDYTSTGNVIRNSIFIEYGVTGSFAAVVVLATIEFDNCIFANYGSGDGITTAYQSPIIKNTYSYAASGTSYATGTLTTSASDDGSNGSTTIAFSTSSGAYFSNITSGSENFHITSSSTLRDAGTDLSGTFTTDIDGETRVAWDIGADEYQAGATTLNAPTLSAPTDTATGQALTVNLVINDTNSSPNETGIIFRIKPSGGSYSYSSQQAANTTSLSAATALGSSLSNSTTYYWSAIAKGDGSTTSDSAYATDYSFTTLAATSSHFLTTLGVWH